nr:MAG: hypothetical protein [Microvirus sp.]
MAKRFKLPKSSSKRLFTKTAEKVQPRNFQGTPMRGGIRL